MTQTVDLHDMPFLVQELCAACGYVHIRFYEKGLMSTPISRAQCDYCKHSLALRFGDTTLLN